jgi:hypothetical protein
MKKIFSKLKIILMIFLVLFTFFHKPKQTQADALVAGGGMYLVSLNPAVLPIAVIGLAACLLVGYTVSNWDEVTAFGGQVANEIVKAGYSISDFVSGTSVKVNSKFKKIVKNARTNTGKTISVYSEDSEVYTGNILTCLKYKESAFSMPLALMSLKSSKSIRFGNLDRMIQDDDCIDVSILTVSVRFSPVNSKENPVVFLEDSNSNSYGFKSKASDVIKSSDGSVIGIDTKFNGSRSKVVMNDVSVRLQFDSFISTDITKVQIPELGINKSSAPISTEKLKSRAIDSQNVDEYIDTAFPNDETIEFNPQADVTTATMVNMPKISNKTLTASQVKSLDDIQANAVSENTGSSSSAGSSSGFWSLLWNWLLRILNAILGIPAAILDGIKTLFATVTDWLAKIWMGICSIPSAIVSGVTGFWEKLLELVESIVKAIEGFNQAIANAITGVFEWCFGLDESWLKGRIETLKETFDSKFPALKPINYKFSDKSSFDDLKMTVPYCGQVTVVESSIVMEYGSVLKNFLRAFFYLITALFFFKRFHKVAED